MDEVGSGSKGVVVVGGGVSGLTVAHRLSISGVEVTVLEAEGRVGGNVRTVDVDGLRLEAGPDRMVARKPWAAELCRELGLGGDLVPPAAGSAAVQTRRGLFPLPSGPFGISTDPIELARWPGLSWRGRLRAATDLVRRPRAGDGDESLGALVRRRLGDEAAEAIVAPLLGGLLAGDLDRISVLATFPELAAWERRHGSLIRGARAAARVARDRPRPPVFLRLRGGLERLPCAIRDTLGDRVRTSMRADRVGRRPRGFTVEAEGSELGARAVVFATPAFVSADLVGGLAPAAASLLRRIRYASTAVVLLVYAEGTGGRIPSSSGFVAPRGMLEMTGCSFVSRSAPDEAFGDRAVVRCFLDADPGSVAGRQTDEEVTGSVSRRLAAMFGLPEAAEHARVIRWSRSMPQYDVGHLDLVDGIERSLPPGLYVTGQAYRGVGLPDCVRDAQRVAERILGSAA